MRTIDADEFGRVIEAWIRMHWSEAFTGDDVGSDFLEMLDEEPTLDVQPVVHAHWILDPDGMDFGLPAWLCSNCRRKNTMIPGIIATKHGGVVPKNPNIFEGSNYCPNCGAKMDEEEGNDTGHAVEI